MLSIELVVETAPPTWLQDIFLLFEKDKAVSEVLINSTLCIGILKEQKWSMMEPLGICAQTLTDLIQEFGLAKGIRLDALSPSGGGCLDYNLQEYRWHAVIPPGASSGPVLMIRKHRFGDLRLEHFKMSEEQNFQLRRLMVSRKNILICGPTGCGKTSLLQSLLKEYATKERVVVVEDIPELPILSHFWTGLAGRKANVNGKGQVYTTDMLKEALRLCPDRIVLGELRGQEERTTLEEMLTSGHSGILTTLHASSVADIRFKLRNLFKGTKNVGEDLYAVFLCKSSPPELKAISHLCQP